MCESAKCLLQSSFRFFSDITIILKYPNVSGRSVNKFGTNETRHEIECENGSKRSLLHNSV